MLRRLFEFNKRIWSEARDNIKASQLRQQQQYNKKYAGSGDAE